MEMPDYRRCFHAAVANAFASPDAAVRKAYFDLANFYRRKLDLAAALHPPSGLLSEIAKVRQ